MRVLYVRRRKSLSAVFGAVSFAMLLTLMSCSRPTNQSVVTEFSKLSQINDNFTLQLFSLDGTSHENAYLGTLQHGTNGIEWPPSIQTYLGSLGASPAPLQYFIKAYATQGSGVNRDVYFEVPVVSSTVVLNGPSTALWLALRASFASHAQPIQMTSAGWQNLLFELDSTCPSCLTHSGSTAFGLIQTSPSLQANLNSVLNSLGNMSFDATTIQNPPLGIAYSTPPTVNGASKSVSFSQAAHQNPQVLFYDPLNLTSIFAPNSWSVFYPATSAQASVPTSADPSIADWTFDFIFTGAEQLLAELTVRGQTTVATINYNVIYTKTNPLISVPPLRFQANHQKTVDLAPYATDPRNEFLTFSLISGPTGVALNGSVLSWNPTQEPTSQIGTNSIVVQVTNVDGANAMALVSAMVSADHYPSFAAGTSFNWNISEGTLGNFSFQALDSDGDPIEAICTSGCTSLLAGSPAAAGWNDAIYAFPVPNPALYSPLPPASPPPGGFVENISIPFMPSYLQTRAVNAGVPATQTFPIVLTLNYPTGDAGLRQVFTPTAQTVNLIIQNVADAPVWTVQPLASSPSSETEAVAMPSMPVSVATDPAYNPGSHAVAYALNFIGDSTGALGAGLMSHCGWLRVNATGQIYGTPAYQSPSYCTVTIRGTDTIPTPAVANLYTDSSAVNIYTTDVPRPFGAPGAIPNQTANEGAPFSLNLAPYMNDPDFNISDPRDVPTFSCLNCATFTPPISTGGGSAIGVMGSTLSWTPPYGMAPVNGTIAFNGIQIQVTKSGGFTTTLTLNLTVNYAPGPFAITFVNGGSLTVSSSAVTVSPNSSGTVQVNLANMPGDNSQYAYTMSATCTPSCSAGIFTLSTTTGGPAFAPFFLNIQPTYADGYGGTTATSGTRKITVTVTDAAASTVFGSSTLTVNVPTLDRALTSLGFNSDSGSPATYLGTIDGGIYTSNSIAFTPHGPDVANDAFNYSFSGTPFGSLVGGVWQFNPLASNCLPGTGSITKTFTVLATSTHGQTIQRPAAVTIQHTTVGGGGSCPY